MMENISNRTLISRLFSAAEQQLEMANFEVEKWSEWYGAVQELTTPEKMVYVIVKMNKSVTNGGFAEFYNSSYGIFAPEIIHVLNEIQANASAEIVASTLSVVNPLELLDDVYKSFVFKVKLSEEQLAKLSTEDVQYDQLDGHENLEELLGNYLQKLSF